MALIEGSFQLISCLWTVVGMTSVFCGFVPQFLMLYKTKNTVAFNKWMFLLQTLVGLFFTLGASIWMVSLDKGISLKNTSTVIRCGINIFMNGSLFCLCAYMVMLKIKNAKAAKTLGISELEHYEKHIKNNIV